MILFPLRGAHPNDIFGFYADPAHYRIIIPILSVRFFSDIALAQAWLVKNNYNISTVYQYIGYLKYKMGSLSKLPRPLDALGIPADAKDDPLVADLYTKTLTTAMLFLLCHELAHVYYQHPTYGTISPAEAQNNEAQADRFSIELMRRIGVIPVGAGFWFTGVVRWQRNRWDCGSQQAWEEYIKDSTHPLTLHRIKSLADLLEEKADSFARSQPNSHTGVTMIRSMANDLTGVAKILEDRGIQQLIKTEGLSTEPHMLAPRYTATYVAQPETLPADYQDIPFNGSYRGQFTSFSTAGGIDITIVFHRDGRKVTGTYTYATSRGKIDGFVQGKTLTFRWFERGDSGKGKFYADDAGKSFTGTWGNMSSCENGGTWNGRRE